jgi:hypothetical protein
MPASERELKYAAILFYKTFEMDLPLLNYSQQDIEYIIQQLSSNPDENTFKSNLLH